MFCFFFVALVSTRPFSSIFSFLFYIYIFFCSCLLYIYISLLFVLVFSLYLTFRLVFFNLIHSRAHPRTAPDRYIYIYFHHYHNRASKTKRFQNTHAVTGTHVKRDQESTESNAKDWSILSVRNTLHLSWSHVRASHTTRIYTSLEWVLEGDIAIKRKKIKK